jgi:hypothetical protein
MLAIYDLNHNPITFNFAEFLINCNFKSFSSGINKYKIIFIQKNFNSIINKNLTDKTYTKHIDSKAQIWRLNNIILPLISCVEDRCIGFEFMQNKKEIKYNLNNYITYPENYNVNFNIRPETTVLKEITSLDHISLKALTQGIKYIKKYLNAINVEEKKIITLTIRYQEYDKPRNSRLDEWYKFANFLKSKGHVVIIVPDTDKAWEINNLFKGFNIFHEGSFNIMLLISLYEVSFFNYFAPGGVSSLCNFNKNTNYIEMKAGPIKNSIVNKEKAFILREKNKNYKFAKNNQILVWADDSYDNLLNTYIKHVVKLN